MNTEATLRCCYTVLNSYVEIIFSTINTLRNSIHPSEMEIWYPPKTACGSPCGGSKDKRSHTQSSHPVKFVCHCTIASMLGDPQNVQLGNVTTAVLPGRCRASRVLICVSCGGAFSSFFLLCILGHLPSVHHWLPGGTARATDITLRTACLPHRVCVAWCRGVPWWFVARLCGGVLSDVLVTGKGMESSSCGDGRWMFRFTAAGTCCMLRPCVRRRMLAIISGCFGLPRPVFCGMLVEVSLAVDEIFCVRAFVSERERERESVCVCCDQSIHHSHYPPNVCNKIPKARWDRCRQSAASDEFSTHRHFWHGVASLQWTLRGVSSDWRWRLFGQESGGDPCRDVIICTAGPKLPPAGIPVTDIHVSVQSRRFKLKFTSLVKLLQRKMTRCHSHLPRA